MEIMQHPSVADFFHRAIAEALDHQQVEAAQPTELYLVDLLGQFTTEPITDQPLSVLLVSATEPASRVKALKQVGDTTLYVSGFFADSLNRKLFDSDYYRELGEAAYRELAHRLAASSVQAVYEELAAKFPHFVDVLAEVACQTQCGATDIVKLYQQWLRSRSEWLERRLRSLGVLIDPPGGHLH
jgi:hypothetical protein